MSQLTGANDKTYVYIFSINNQTKGHYYMYVSSYFLIRSVTEFLKEKSETKKHVCFFIIISELQNIEFLAGLGPSKYKGSKYEYIIN